MSEITWNNEIKMYEVRYEKPYVKTLYTVGSIKSKYVDLDHYFLTRADAVFYAKEIAHLSPSHSFIEEVTVKQLGDNIVIKSRDMSEIYKYLRANDKLLKGTEEETDNIPYEPISQKIKDSGIIYSLYSKPVIDVCVLYQAGHYFSVDNNVLVFSTFEKAHDYIETENIIGYSVLKMDIMVPTEKKPSFYIVDEDLNTIRGVKLKCDAITNSILYWRDKMDR